MMLSSDTLQRQYKQIASLYQTKNNYEQMIAKYQSLPKIIEQKKEIIDNLKISNNKLSHQILFRTDELDQLKKRLQEFQRMESLVSKLQERQRYMQSQYEDYQQLNTKLQKQIKFLQQQSQVLKGKAIIEYNRITEVREELATQTKQKQYLQKYLEEMKKNGENIKKKIKTLKQEQKKKATNKRRIQEFDLQKEVNNLIQRYQQSKRQFQLQSNIVYVNQQQYKEIMQQIQKVKESNIIYDQQINTNQKLKDERTQLQARIAFLQSVDIEFINQKKMFLVQLKEKYNLLYAQKQSQTQHAEKLEKQLAELVLKCPEGLAQLKKNARKKKQPKPKSPKKIKETIQQPIQCELQQKKSRFKGQKCKKIFAGFIIILTIFGLVMSHTIGYII